VLYITQAVVAGVALVVQDLVLKIKVWAEVAAAETEAIVKEIMLHCMAVAVAALHKEATMVAMAIKA
jgi:hypothetical protein